MKEPMYYYIYSLSTYMEKRLRPGRFWKGNFRFWQRHFKFCIRIFNFSSSISTSVVIENTTAKNGKTAAKKERPLQSFFQLCSSTIWIMTPRGGVTASFIFFKKGDVLVEIYDSLMGKYSFRIRILFPIYYLGAWFYLFNFSLFLLNHPFCHLLGRIFIPVRILYDFFLRSTKKCFKTFNFTNSTIVFLYFWH